MIESLVEQIEARLAEAQAQMSDPEVIEIAIAAMEAVLAVEDPRAASEEDKVGMEVVA